MSQTIGDVLGGRYTLRTRIAAGGMGEVWEAEDSVLRRLVAVKVLRPNVNDDRRFAERFRDEARHTAMLSHANIATVYDYGEEQGTAYLVMELVPGTPLSKVISERGPINPEETRLIIGQAANALAAAHAAGVIHRDVKPANIILTPEGRVKLTDFGIARALDGSSLTRTGEVIGTPNYLAPEQALGQPATAASDIYALGIVAHEMLTGVRPFEAGSPVATALAQVSAEPPPLPASVPTGLAATVMQCLRKVPQDRPVSAAALAAALGMAPGIAGMAPTQQLPVADPASVIPPPVPAAQPATQPPGDKPRRGALWVVVPMVLLLAVITFFGYRFIANPSTTPDTVYVTTYVDPPKTTPTPTISTSTATPTTTAPAKVTITESDYLGRPGTQVAAEIKALGLTVLPLVAAASTEPADSVLSVSPNGQVPRDAKITITVSEGPQAPATP